MTGTPTPTIAKAPPKSAPVGSLRVGLVLGGGGAMGAAYHAGALAALEHDLGWDPRSADIIVGTSAGSLTGTLLRLGVAAQDLAALTVGAKAMSVSSSLATQLADRPQFPAFGLGHLLRLPRVPSPVLMAGLLRVGVRRRASALASLMLLLPAGRAHLLPHLTFLDDHFNDDWPVDPLLVCAVRANDCRRAVFDGTGRQGRLSLALAASCAVPGYFSPVAIDGAMYVDGGAISATNADVLRRHDLDLAIVVSPMTGAARSWSVADAARRFCRRAVDHEVRMLKDAGIATVVIEPGRQVTDHMSMDFMSEATSTAIVQAAFFDTGRQISASETLAALRSGRRVEPPMAGAGG